MYIFNKIFLYVFLILFLSGVFTMPAKAQEYASVTDDAIIIKALDLLKDTTGEWSRQAILGSNLSGKPVKISFKDLKASSDKHRDYDSLGWIANKQFYIFVDSKNKKAPPEALACLLAHEAIHQDIFNSIKEETYGGGYEADIWIQLKARNPELNKLDEKTTPLIKRLNELEESFRKGDYTTTEIRLLVEKNNIYQTLPLTSYGFGR
jgi:hypothetical protein